MRRKQLIAITICLMLISMQVACIKKPVDTSRIILTGVNKVFIDTQTKVIGMINDSSIPAQTRANLYKQVAGPMDKLKEILNSINACQIAWDLSGIKPAELDSLNAKFTAQSTLVNSILAIGGVK